MSIIPTREDRAFERGMIQGAAMRADTAAVPNRDLAHMLLCSFRYALGRRTAMVSRTVDWLTRYWPLMADFHEQIHCDIRRAIERRDAGSQCDIDDWRKVLALPAGEKS